MPIGRATTDYAGMAIASQSATAQTASQFDKKKIKKKGDASSSAIGGALAGSAIGEGMGQLNFNKAAESQTAPVGGSIEDGIAKGIGTGGMSAPKAQPAFAATASTPAGLPSTAAPATPTPATSKPGMGGAGWGAAVGAGLGLMAHYLDE